MFKTVKIDLSEKKRTQNEIVLQKLKMDLA